ncbi:MAG: FAD-dependent oxidoreductase, partial [Planctomycetota bacterium]
FAPGEVDLPTGFGYLVPPREAGPEAPRTLGTIFASNLFPDRAPAGGAAVSCFYAAEEVESLDAMSFCDLAAADLARALGLPAAPAPAATWTVLWRRAIPQYLPEHDRRLAALEADLGRRAPGIDLAGSWTRGVSVEHVLERGREIGEGLVAAFATASPAAPRGPA